MSLPGNIDIQFRLFEDYRNHVARFARIAGYQQVASAALLSYVGSP